MDFKPLIRVMCAASMAVGPGLSYVPQYCDLQRTRSCKGFSSAICFILLTSSILRILSYIMERYDFAMLLQSILMVVAQLLVLHLIVRLSSRGIASEDATTSHPNAPTETQSKQRRSYLQAFWAWSSFAEYVLFLAIFTAFFGAIVALQVLWIQSPILPKVSLYVSTLLESTLCMPQFYKNWRNKSTHGLNKMLVAAWIAGDAYKLGYAVLFKTGGAFVVCPVIQLAVDFAIICQFVMYSRWMRTSRAPSIVPLKQTVPSVQSMESMHETSPSKNKDSSIV